MKASLGHIGINLSSTDSIQFWKELLKFLEFEFLVDYKTHFDATDGNSYLCVGVTGAKFKGDGFHRKRTGLNHIALRMETPGEVDKFAREFLEKKKIPTLYGGVKDYPEYVKGYRAVYFEDPDKIKVEVVYEP